jgi:hypothetical protein
LGCPWNIDILEKTIPPVLEFLSFGNQQDQVKEDADFRRYTQILIAKLIGSRFRGSEVHGSRVTTY